MSRSCRRSATLTRPSVATAASSPNRASLATYRLWLPTGRPTTAGANPSNRRKESDLSADAVPVRVGLRRMPPSPPFSSKNRRPRGGPGRVAQRSDALGRNCWSCTPLSRQSPLSRKISLTHSADGIGLDLPPERHESRSCAVLSSRQFTDAATTATTLEAMWRAPIGAVRRLPSPVVGGTNSEQALRANRFRIC